MGAGGKGYGPDKSPGMARGPNSVNSGMNPAPMPRMNKSQAAKHATPDRKKVMQMKDEEYRKRESGRGMGSI